MVSCHDNKRLVRMGLVERISNVHRLVHIPYLTESGSRIIPMARVIDHTAFYHHKESIIALLQERNRRTYDLRQVQIAFFAVDRIG